MRKLAGWALAAFVIFYLARDPAGAAGLIRHLAGALESAGIALSKLINDL